MRKMPKHNLKVESKSTWKGQLGWPSSCSRFIGVEKNKNFFSSSVHYHRANIMNRFLYRGVMRAKASQKGLSFFNSFNLSRYVNDFQFLGLLKMVGTLLAFCCFLSFLSFRLLGLLLSLQKKKKKEKKRLLGLFLVLWIDGFCNLHSSNCLKKKII